MAITADEAAGNIGRLVMYQAPDTGNPVFFNGKRIGDQPRTEEGRIVGVSKTRAGQRYVFVNFGRGTNPACRPEDLSFSIPTTTPKES